MEPQAEVATPLGCISVGDVVVDVEGYFLRREDSIVRLEPRSWDVLLYLLRNPGRLISKQELVDEVWRGAIVSDAAVSQAVLRVRSALGDSSKSPSYVETVPRKGYRFIAPVAAEKPAPPESRASVVPLVASYPFVAPDISEGLIGRLREIGLMLRYWRQVTQGKPHIVMVEGEAGIGKSELIRVVLDQIRFDTAADGLFSARTFCAEHIGPGEAYLPVYELLSRFDLGQSDINEMARQVAPSWFQPMATNLKRRLVPESAEYALSNSPKVMEIVYLVRTLSRVKPCAIVVEDVHWGDTASVAVLESLIEALGEGDRVMIILSCRNGSEMASNELVQSFARMSERDNFHSVSLETLREEESRLLVNNRLSRTMTHEGLSEGRVQCLRRQFARIVWHWAGGNPLYATSLTDYLVENRFSESLGQGWVSTFDQIPLPSNLVEAIEIKCDTYSVIQQNLLACASIIGLKFTLEELAALEDVHGCSREKLEVFLQPLVDAQFLVWTPQMHPGEGRGSIRFAHALYRQVVYGRVPASERRHLHLRIAEIIEREHGARQHQFAALGRHFAEAGLIDRAIPYLKLTVKKMRHQGAESQAIHYLQKILDLLPHICDPHVRDAEELSARVDMLGASLEVSRDYDLVSEVSRILELNNRIKSTDRSFARMSCTFRAIFLVARMDISKPVVDVMSRLADVSDHPWERMVTEFAKGCLFHIQGHIGKSSEKFNVAEQAWQQLKHSVVQEPVFGLRLYSVMAWTMLFEDKVESAIALLNQVCHDQSYIDPSARITVLYSRASMNMLLGRLEQIEDDLFVVQKLSQDLDQHSMAFSSEFLRFWLNVRRGEPAPDDQEIERMWSNYRLQPHLTRLPIGAHAFVDGLIVAGKCNMALKVIDELIEDHDHVGFHRDLPELLRLQVTALSGQGVLRDSIDITPRVGGMGSQREEGGYVFDGDARNSALALADPVVPAGLSSDPVMLETERSDADNCRDILLRAQSIAEKQGNLFWLRRIEATMARLNF